MLLLAAESTAQDELFELVPAEAPARDLALPLGKAGRLLLADGALTLAGEPLPCTMSDGPGRIHAISREPSGRVVVGAENGLFVLDAAHPVLDGMDVRDGVGHGPFLDVRADDQGRIWYCTPDAVGVVDAAYGFGRTFPIQEGGPTGFTRLWFDDGRLFVKADAGVWAYRPDQGEPPRTATGEVARAELTASVDGVAPFALYVQANGGAMLRQRVEHHHLLTPIDDARLSGLHPGNLTVDVYAVDRDLRRARVASYRVHVPLPPQFSTRYLPGLVAGAGVLLFWLSWPRRGRRRFWRAMLRAGVIGIVGLQLIAATMGYGRSWPFMGFSMYTENYFEGSVLYKPAVFGVTADGRRVKLTDWQMGLMQDGYWHLLSEIVFDPDQRFDKIVRVVKRRRRLDVVGFDVYDNRIRLTRNGPVDVAPTLVCSWRKR